jgi:hypothetical protein
VPFWNGIGLGADVPSIDLIGMIVGLHRLFVMNGDFSESPAEYNSM